MPSNKTPTVEISEYKKDPEKYLRGDAIAIIAEGNVLGYAIGDLEFRALLDIIRQCEKTETFVGQFNSSKARLREISEKCQSRLKSYEPEAW